MAMQPLEPAIRHAVTMLGWSALVLSASTLLIAALDVPFQLFDHSQKLRMSMQQVRDDQNPGSAIPPLEHLLPEVDVGVLVEALVGLVQEDQLRPVQRAEDDVELLLGPARELPGRDSRARPPPELRCQVVPGRRGSAPANSVDCTEEAEVLVGGQQG